MPAILPLLCFLAILLLFRKFHLLGWWRGSFLLASIIGGLVLTAMTEAFNLGSGGEQLSYGREESVRRKRLLKKRYQWIRRAAVEHIV